MQTPAEWIGQYGYAGLFLLLAVGVFGLPVPDETLLALAGYLVHNGDLKFLPTIIAGFTGSACGITVSYILGRTAGIGVVHKFGPWLHITENRLEKVRVWLTHGGRWALVIGYFVPGVRHLTGIIAGTSGLPLKVFAMFAYSGAFLWANTFIVAGFFLGRNWQRVLGVADRNRIIVVVGVATVLLFYFLIRRIRKRSDS
jgi:membrane protein DedA with SNARE-associated domain